VNSLAFTPDGRWLITGTSKAAKVWDLKTGQLERELTADDPGLLGRVRVLALSADGTTLATTGERDELFIWNLIDGTRKNLKCKEHVNGAVFTKDGKTIYSLHSETVCRWNIADAAVTATTDKDLPISYFDDILVVTPDGKTVAVGGKNGDVLLLDGETLKEKKRLLGHTRTTSAMSLSPDGTTLVTVGIEDPIVRLWDIAKGTEIRTLQCDKRRITRAAFSPTGRYLALGGDSFWLWEVATGRQLDKIPGFRGNAEGLAFSPDGTMVAAVSVTDPGISLLDLTLTLETRAVARPKDRTLVAVAPGATLGLIRSEKKDEGADLWDLMTGKLDRASQAKLHGGAAFSHDGKLLAHAGEANQLLLVDPASGETKTTIELKHRHAVIVFRADGKRLALGVWGGYEVWDIEGAEPKQLFEAEAQPRGAKACSFSPDGKTLALGTGSSLTLVDALSGKVAWSSPAHEEDIGTVEFSADGQRILTAGGNHDLTARVWDAASGKAVAVLRHDQLAPGADARDKLPGVRYAFFGPDPGTVVTCTADGMLHLWDMAKTTRLGTRKVRESDSTAMFSPDRKIFVTASETEFHVWETGAFGRTAFALTGEAVRDSFAVPTADSILPIRESHYLWSMHSHFCDYSADGSRLVAVDSEYRAMVWDAKTGKELNRLNFHRQTEEQNFALSPDGKRMALSLYDATVRIMDLETGEELKKLVGHGDFVRCVAFSPDGKWLASGRNNGELILWDAKTGEKVREFPREHGWIDKIVFSPDSKWLVTGTSSGLGYVFDVPTGKLRASLKHSSSVGAVAVSRDGKLIALGGETLGGIPENDVTVWDSATGKQVYVLRGHPWGVTHLAFGTDGLLTASTWGTLAGYTYLWDTNTGKFIARLPVGSAHAISPDGKTLAMFNFQRVDLIDLTIARDPRVQAALAPILALKGSADLDGDVVQVWFDLRGPDSYAALEALKTYPYPLALNVGDIKILPDAAVRSIADCKTLCRLSVRSDGLTDEQLKTIAGMSNLEELSLVNCTDLTPTGLTVLAKLEHLTRLSLANTKVNADTLLQLAKLPNLRALVLERTTTGVDGLAALAKFPKLEELVVGSSDGVEGYANLGKMKALRRLTLSDSGIGPQGFVHLKGLTQLEELDLSRTGATDESLAELSGLVNLRRLDLSNTRVTDKGFMHLKKLTKLNSLTIAGLEDFTGTGLSQLSMTRGLTELNLRFTKVTDDGLAALKDWTQLRSLTLPREVTDGGLANIAGLTELQVLRMEDAEGVTDKGVAHLKGLTKLLELNLGSTKITDECLKYIVDMKSLRVLRTSFTGVSSKALKQLRKQLPMLETD
jgi:WD40 repeat protein/Leucine-rich repeat (LRR) protein